MKLILCIDGSEFQSLNPLNVTNKKYELHNTLLGDIQSDRAILARGFLQMTVMQFLNYYLTLSGT